MPRYLIERAWDAMEEEMTAKGSRSKQLLTDNAQFSPVTWEHSHVVMDDEGRLMTFCVYASPNTGGVRCATLRRPRRQFLDEQRIAGGGLLDAPGERLAIRRTRCQPQDQVLGVGLGERLELHRDIGWQQSPAGSRVQELGSPSPQAPHV